MNTFPTYAKKMNSLTMSYPPGLSHVLKLHFSNAAAVIEDPPLAQVAWKTQGGCNFHKKITPDFNFPFLDLRLL